MRKVQASETALLSAARQAAMRLALDKTKAAHHNRKAQGSSLISQRYADRFARIFRDFAPNERQAALAKLKDEQAEELAAFEVAERAKLADEERGVRTAIASAYKSSSQRLRRKQRQERALLGLSSTATEPRFDFVHIPKSQIRRHVTGIRWALRIAAKGKRNKPGPNLPSRR